MADLVKSVEAFCQKKDVEVLLNIDYIHTAGQSFSKMQFDCNFADRNGCEFAANHCPVYEDAPQRFAP